MSVEKTLYTWSRPVLVDSTNYQYHAMKLGTDRKFALADASDVCIGILQDNPDTAGKAGLVCMLGISKAVCDGSTAIAPQDRLAANAFGHLVKTTTDSDDYIAIALDDVTADGVIASVFVMPFGKLAGTVT